MAPVPQPIGLMLDKLDAELIDDEPGTAVGALTPPLSRRQGRRRVRDVGLNPEGHFAVGLPA